MTIFLDPSMTQGGTIQARNEHDAKMQSLHNDYTKSRNAFADQHMRRLGDTHPQLHGGHRTIEDVHNDLDTGNKILHGGNPEFKTHRMWSDERKDHSQTHEHALEVGYAANAHKYYQRQSNAEHLAEIASRPPKPSKNYGF